MLNNEQIKYLCSIAEIPIVVHQDQVVGLKPAKEHLIKTPYEDFKNGMGLEDIRFSWLMGRNNFLAGGCVLDWIRGEPNPNDYDFFFYNSEAAESFKLVIQNYGFTATKDSGYATTLFNLDERVVIQVVGQPYREEFFGNPIKVLNSFDIKVCQFAVDAQSVCCNSRAIHNLITRSIELNNIHDRDVTTSRVMKYCAKGFYATNRDVWVREKDKR